MKMSEIVKFLAKLLIMAGLIKPVMDLMVAVESPGNGDEKKALVINLIREMLLAGNELVPGMEIDPDEYLPFLERIFEALIAFLKLIGKI